MTVRRKAAGLESFAIGSDVMLNVGCEGYGKLVVAA